MRLDQIFKIRKEQEVCQITRNNAARVPLLWFLTGMDGVCGKFIIGTIVLVVFAHLKAGRVRLLVRILTK